MLQNAYFLAKIGADTAENEQHFAEILPKIGGVPTRCPAPKEARQELREHAQHRRRDARDAEACLNRNLG